MPTDQPRNQYDDLSMEHLLLIWDQESNHRNKDRFMREQIWPRARRRYQETVERLRVDHTIRDHTILIAVVSTPALVLYSIDAYRPRFVYLLSSPAMRERSGDLREGIIADSEYDGAFSHDTVTVLDFSDNVGTTDIYRLINRVRNQHPANESIVVDITGGTSSMTAGAAMAGNWVGATISAIQSTYISVPGMERTTFEPGTQRPLVIEDPYHVFGDRDRQRALTRMAGHDYQGAVELLTDMVQRLGASHGDDQLLLLAEAYRAWEAFGLTGAHQRLGRLYAATDLLPWIDRAWLGYQLEILSASHDSERQNRQYEPMIAHAFVAMLLAAAERRRSQRRHDIASLTLYRCLEYLAQQRLVNTYQIAIDDGGLVWKPQMMELAASRGRTFYPDASSDWPGLIEKWKLLLHAINDDLITRDLMKAMREVTTLRNSTIFAHGFAAVPEDDYQRLLNLTGSLVSRWQQRTPLPDGADFTWIYRYARFIPVPPPALSPNSQEKPAPAARPQPPVARPPVKPADSGAMKLERVVSLVRQAAPRGGDTGSPTAQQRLDFIRQRLAPLHRELNANPPPELTAQRCAGALTDCWLILDQLAELIVTGRRPPKWETMAPRERYVHLVEVEPAESPRRQNLIGALRNLTAVPPSVLLAGSPAELVGTAAPDLTKLQCDSKLLNALRGQCESLLVRYLRQTEQLLPTEKVADWLKR